MTFWACVFSRVSPHNWAITCEVLCLCSVSLFVPSQFLLTILYICVCGIHLRRWLACRRALACSFRALNPDFHHQRSGLSADRGRIGNFSPRLLDPLKGNVTEMSFTDTHHQNKKNESFQPLWTQANSNREQITEQRIMILLDCSGRRETLLRSVLFS